MSSDQRCQWVDPGNGLIDRAIFTNRDIFEQEQETIFTRSWLFIGHDSQIPKPGDFVSTRMGTEPLSYLPKPGRARGLFLCWKAQ